VNAMPATDSSTPVAMSCTSPNRTPSTAIADNEYAVIRQLRIARTHRERAPTRQHGATHLSAMIC
jgi:hypothetical protein